MTCPSKKCFECLVVKPLEAFYRHSGMADGHLNKCKDCYKVMVAQRRLDKIEEVRAYDRERGRRPEAIAAQRRVFKAYVAKYPERRRANDLVARAVLMGTLVPQPCWVCGKKAGAHHPDYDRPLDVVWLCQAHHKQAHAIVQPGDSGKLASAVVDGTPAV